MQAVTKQSWPRDAVIIVASIAGTEVRERMSAIAMDMPERNGRPEQTYSGTTQ